MTALTASRTTAETELVLLARQGDRAAFGELVRGHLPGVVTVVYRMCGDLPLAEDAAQEAFLQAWLHLEAFQPGSSLRNWLYRIAVNAALDTLRRGRERSSGALDALPAADPQPGPEGEAIRAEQARRVQRAILDLPETSRSALVLREYGGLSYQEIAAALDVPVGTVMSRLNHARGQLRELLSTELEAETDHE